MDGERERESAVLAFLLGTTRTLELDDTSSQGSARSSSSSSYAPFSASSMDQQLPPRTADAHDGFDPDVAMLESEEDASELGSISENQETQAAAGAMTTNEDESIPILEEVASDWDTLTSCESEDEPAAEGDCHDTKSAAQQGEAPNESTEKILPETSVHESRRNNNSIEVESEDDCAISTCVTHEQDDDKSSRALAGLGMDSNSSEPQSTTAKATAGCEDQERKTSTPEHSASSPPPLTVRAPVLSSPPKQSTAKYGSATSPRVTRDGRAGGLQPPSPTLEEFLFICCVATMLLAYVCACVYSFFHPLSVPFPDHEGLQSAFDLSNVSIAITSPPNDSQITQLGVAFEWELDNFPMAALHEFGPEVFQYHVYLDETLVASEFGFLTGPKTPEVAIFNETVRFSIPAHSFASVRSDGDANDGDKRFKFHLVVKLPIPGLLGELQSFEQIVFVREAAPASPDQELQLQIDSPADGAVFEPGQSVLLEYTAMKVMAMETVVDGVFWLRKSHAGDGRLLVRGLGAGPHSLELRALDQRGEAVAASAVHVEIMDVLES